MIYHILLAHTQIRVIFLEPWRKEIAHTWDYECRRFLGGIFWRGDPDLLGAMFVCGLPISMHCVKVNWIEILVVTGEGGTYPVPIPLIKNHNSVSSFTGGASTGMPTKHSALLFPFNNQAIVSVTSVIPPKTTTCPIAGTNHNKIAKTGRQARSESWKMMRMRWRVTTLMLSHEPLSSSRGPEMKG